MADTPRIEELRRRVQVDPASIAFAALAEEYRRAGRYEEAIATCTAGLQRHPAYLSAHVTLGRALLEVGQYDEAREELEHVLKLAPENLAAIRGLAEIHHRRGELPESQESYAQPAAEEAPASDAPSAAAAEPESAPAWEYGVVDSAPASASAPELATPSAVAVPSAAAVPIVAAAEPEMAPAWEYGVVDSAPASGVATPSAAGDVDAEPETARAWEYGVVDPSPAPAPPLAAAPVPGPPVPDPAVAELESFLASILRARESASSARN